MESAVAAPVVGQGRSRWRPQLSLFSALILMLLLAVIVGMGVKIWQLQQVNRELELQLENSQQEKSMLEYAIRKMQTL